LQLAGSEVRLWVRILTLLILAAVMSLGAAFILENDEVNRITGESLFRQLLILAAPLAGLSLTNFGMFSKSFGRKDLVLEVLIVAVSYFLFLTIAVPISLWRDSECLILTYVCDETDVVAPIVSGAAIFGILATLSYILVLRIQRVYRTPN